MTWHQDALALQKVRQLLELSTLLLSVKGYRQGLIASSNLHLNRVTIKLSQRHGGRQCVARKRAVTQPAAVTDEHSVMSNS